VDQACGVGRVEGRGHLRHDGGDTGQFEQRVRPDQRLEVAPIDEAHGQVQQAVRFAGVVDRNDVGMLERSGELRFADEPIPEPLVLRELGGEDLEGRPTPEAQVLREIDHPHATAPDHRIDAVAGQFGPEQRVHVAGVVAREGRLR